MYHVDQPVFWFEELENQIRGKKECLAEMYYFDLKLDSRKSIDYNLDIIQELKEVFDQRGIERIIQMNDPIYKILKKTDRVGTKAKQILGPETFYDIQGRCTLKLDTGVDINV